MIPFPYQTGQFGRRAAAVGGGGGGPIQLMTTNNVTDATSQSSRSIALPTGIVAGDFIMVLYATLGRPTLTLSSGWAQIAYTSVFNVGYYILYKVATGSDALTVTQSLSTVAVYQGFRVENAGNVYATQRSDGANPYTFNALAPAPGNAEYLWFASIGGIGWNPNPWSPTSTGFSTLQYNATGNGGSHCSLGSHYLLSTTDTLTPSGWTDNIGLGNANVVTIALGA